MTAAPAPDEARNSAARDAIVPVLLACAALVVLLVALTRLLAPDEDLPGEEAEQPPTESATPGTDGNAPATTAERPDRREADPEDTGSQTPGTAGLPLVPDPPGGAEPPAPPSRTLDPRQGPNDMPAVPERGVFRIRGDLRGVHPGFEGALVVELHNGHPFALLVHEVTVEVGEPRTRDGQTSQASACRSHHLHIQSARDAARVPATSVATVELRASMPPSAPNTCQGAAFPLRYDGWAVRLEG